MTVTPCVLRAEENPQEITLHAREAYARKLLGGVARIRLFQRESPTIKWRKWRSFGEWLRNTPPSEFRRRENGDLAVTVTTPVEGEYALCLDFADQEGAFVEKAVFALYALEDDLYRLTPYKGDFHMHSTSSDGAHSPEYVAATCRKCGFDFMALTDHRQYDPSLVARKAMAEFGCDMLVTPGEEVHLPDNGVHIINFGGRASINQLAADDEPAYFAAVDEYMATVPEKYDEVTRFQVASSEWAFDRIRECGGIAMFCHPYWKPGYHNYIGGDTIDLIMERNRFDVLEVIGGFEIADIEDNFLAVSRWQEEKAKGKKIPVAGVSDSHNCDTSLTGWYYTIVFAEELSFDSLAAAIRSDRGVAVHCPPGNFPLAVGPFRLTRYAYFLLREVYPAHDELCRVEGEIMLRALAGEQPDARRELARRRGTVEAYLADRLGRRNGKSTPR
jgi:hypothetical protein